MMAQALTGLAVNLLFALLTMAARALDRRGALAGALVGALVWAGAGWRGWSLLLLFVVGGSVLTRVGYGRKRRLGAAQERGGRRGVREVLANGAVAALAALGLGLQGSPLWALALAGALGTALADTAASELGPLIGRRTVLAASFRPVPPGTEGAVSLEGTLAGLLAAFLLAALGFGIGLLPPAALWIVPLAAGLGSWFESVLGSLVSRGPLAVNEVQNLLNTFADAALAASIGSAAT